MIRTPFPPTLTRYRCKLWSARTLVGISLLDRGGARALAGQSPGRCASLQMNCAKISTITSRLTAVAVSFQKRSRF